MPRCKECDEYNTMEWCDDCDNTICTHCRYEVLESCNTHRKEAK